MGFEGICMLVAIFHLNLPAVQCGWWSVTYSTTRVCGLEGASVVLPCKYEYSLIGHYIGGEWYEERSERLRGHDHSRYPDCSLRLDKLTADLRGVYHFRFYTALHLSWITHEPGITVTVTALQVFISPKTVKNGENVTFTCNTTCTLRKNPTFIWYKNRQPVTYKHITRDNKLLLNPVSIEDAGSYSCAVRRYESLPSNYVFLNVRYRPRHVSVSIKVSGEIQIATSVTLNCSSDANPPVHTYTWYMKSGAESLVRGTGETINFNVTSDTSGLYYCEAQNELGSQNSTDAAVPPKDLDIKTLPLDDFRTLILVKEDINWNDGSNICTSHYTDLVTLYDETDEQQLIALFELDPKYFMSFIGLKKGNSYIWSNGDPVIYERKALHGHNKCVAMKANGDWDALNCTQNRTFICYSDAPGDSSWYTLMKEEKSWYEAQDYCREKHTDLVSIKDEEQNHAVYTEKRKHPDDSWIGLIRDGWEWADGGLSGYRNWSSDADFSDPDRSVVRISLYDKGWMPTTENTSAALFCYKDHIHISNVSMTWDQSLDYCRGQNLSSFFCIRSPKEQLAAKRLMRRLQITEPVWVGLQQSSIFGFWIWTIGEAVAWNNWKGGQVPQLPDSRHCGALTPEKDDFKWADINCMTKQRALCYDWTI